MVAFGPGDVHDGMTPLDVAHVYLGVLETTGPNRGPMIDEWLRFVGLDPEADSYPWCAAFVSWCCDQGKRPITKSAGVKKLYLNNQELWVRAPARGDVLVHLEPSGKGHTGFFTRALPSGVFESIEGNTNELGGREGNAVAIKSRPRSYWHHAFRPPG